MLVFSIEKFASLDVDVAKKTFAGIGEKIVYSAIALFFSGMYDFIKIEDGYDGFLIFISFPIGLFGVVLIELSTKKGE